MWNLLILNILILTFTYIEAQDGVGVEASVSAGLGGGDVSVSAGVSVSFTDAETQNICEGAYNRFKHAAICLNGHVLQRLLSGSSQNAIGYSPLGTSLTLFILAFHSEGSTRNEIFRTLGLRSTDEIRCVFNATSQIITNLTESMELNSTVYMFANNSLEFTESFSSNVEEYGFGEALTLNFTDTTESANEMNEMINEVTEANFNLISPEDLNNVCTRLISLSGLRYRFNWSIRFNESDSTEDSFQISRDSSIQVTFLHQEQPYRYVDSQRIGAQVVELPFLNLNFSLLIILPNARSNVNRVLQRISDYRVFSSVYEALTLATVDLYVPFLNYTSVVNAKGTLSQANFISSIYHRATARLSNIFSGNENVWISAGRQAINAEYTTEGGDPPQGPLPSNRVTLHINRPFITYLMIGGIPAFGSVTLRPQ